MNKTYKKSDISKLKNESTAIEEDEINELINSDGTMIDRDDNFKANTRIVRSKKTTDDFIRGATQGPEAYFIYGGPYYGINYSYTVNEEENLTEEEDIYDELEIVPEFPPNKDKSARKYADRDIRKYFNKPAPPFYDDLPTDKWRKHSLPYDTEFDVDLYSEQEMKSLVDEIIHNKKNSGGMVKRSNEQGVMGGLNQPIPDISELKQIHQKPMVIRKMNLFLDLIHKEGLNGDELAIVINHIIDNVDITKLSDEYKEIIGDKIKYGNEGQE